MGKEGLRMCIVLVLMVQARQAGRGAVFRWLCGQPPLCLSSMAILMRAYSGDGNRGAGKASRDKE